jgi:hypothetical protein
MIYLWGVLEIRTRRLRHLHEASIVVNVTDQRFVNNMNSLDLYDSHFFPVDYLSHVFSKGLSRTAKVISTLSIDFVTSTATRACVSILFLRDHQAIPFLRRQIGEFPVCIALPSLEKDLDHRGAINANACYSRVHIEFLQLS